MGLIRRKPNTDVVRSEQKPLPPSSAPQVFIGQDGVAYYQHPQTGQMLPAPQQPQQGGMMQGHPAGRGSLPGALPGAGEEDFIGFEGRIGVRYNADGSTTHVTDGHIRSRRTEGVPAGGGAYDAYIGGRWSKRRLAIGAVLALLVLMVAVDILGMPHYRTAPGVYVGLEGEKTTPQTDLPMIALIRLDRSVFAYTLDGVGWVFGAVGGVLEGDSEPDDDSSN